MSKIVYRFSFLACVLSDYKKGNLTYNLEYYLSGSDYLFLLDFDLSLLPKNYNGDNYDLIFNANNEFIKAEKDLKKTNQHN